MTKRLVSVIRQTCCKTRHTSPIKTMWVCKLERVMTSLSNLLLRQKLRKRDEIKVLMLSLSTILQIQIYRWLTRMRSVYRRTDMRENEDKRHSSLTWITRWSKSTRTFPSCKLTRQLFKKLYPLLNSSQVVGAIRMHFQIQHGLLSIQSLIHNHQQDVGKTYSRERVGHGWTIRSITSLGKTCEL